MAAKREHEGREPLIRLTRRENFGRGKSWATRIGSILVALLLGCVMFSALGYNPISVYAAIFNGSLGSLTAFQQTLKIATPLLGASVAIAPAFKMKFWNIGVEGQVTMGAIFSTFVALTWQDALPAFPLLLLMFLAGALGGAIWGMIPAVFRAKWGTNETLFTLMLNYIAIGLVKWLQGGPWEKIPKGTQQIALFSQSARLPSMGKVTSGLIIVLVLVVLMFCYLRYSKQGYQIAVVGESVETARYAGINVSRVIVRTMGVSGAVAGIVGFIMVSGINYTLSDSVAGGVGFTGITVAWLAQLNTFGMILITMLLAVLDKGASTVSTLTNNVISADLSDILTGMILFCMLASEFFIRYRLLFRKKQKDEEGGVSK